VRAEDGDQLGRNGHQARRVGGAVLEPSFVVGRVGAGPASVDLGAGFRQGEAASPGLGQVAVLEPQTYGLGGPERGELPAGIQRR
jgi:hypothetical protein